MERGKHIPRPCHPQAQTDMEAGKQEEVSAGALDPAVGKQEEALVAAPSEELAEGKEKAKPAAPSEELAEGKKKVKPASGEDPAGEDKIKAADAGDGPAELPVDMVLAVAARLPSKDVGRAAVLSKTYRDRLREPFFLESHLAPRSRFFVGDVEPNSVVLQPAADGLRHGYTHLTIIDVRPGGIPIVYDMPVRCADEEDDDGGHYYDYTITYDIDDGPQPARAPAPFFRDTVPGLDLHLLASEGRLLLAHSPTHGVFVCNPREDRCVRLPTPPLGHIDSCRTAAAIRYKLGSWGEIDEFDVVLLSPLPSGHVALQRFSTGGGGHGDGVWVITGIGDESVLAVVAGVSAPGIYASEADAFYWINDHTGSLIEYLLDDRLLSVILPPPETDGYPRRMGWSLGSMGGQPRLSSFSVPGEAHAFSEISMNGIVSVCIKNQTEWVTVKEVLVPIAWAFWRYCQLELPVDASRAAAEYLMVRKDRVVLWRDLKTDEVEFVSNLYLRADSQLSEMYSRFKAFSV